MPFPALPSTLNVYRFAQGRPPIGPPALAAIPARLQQARTQFQYSATTLTPTVYRYIYTPSRTDIRVDPDGSNGDTLELPAGSGTFYVVLDIQDYLRDEADEQRRCLVVPDFWAFPIL
jgi:hypothetical protein